MRRFILPAAMAAIVALSASCRQDGPDGPDPQPPVELVNELEYNGVTASLASRFIDMESETAYFVVQEGVTSAEQLADGDYEYVSLCIGDAEVVSDRAEIDLADVPSGFLLRYVRNSDVLVEVSESPAVPVEGGMSVSAVMDGDSSTLILTVDFAMSAEDGTVLRCNAEAVQEVEQPLYPGERMTFVVDGEVSEVGTAAVENFDGYVMFTVTPEPEAGLFNDIFEGNYDYIQVLILPGLLDRDLDVLTESVTIYGWRNSDGTSLSIAPDGGRELLEEGTVRIDCDGETGEYVLRMYLDFVSGPEVGVNASGMMTGEVPEEGSTIAVNGEIKPVRASFYLVEDGLAMLYFTSAGVYYFDEMIESALNWFCVVLEEDALTGEEMDVASAGRYYQLTFMDNLSGEMLTASSDDPAGVSGTLSVSRSASEPERFTAAVDVTFHDGTSVSVDFDDACMSVDYMPEEPNELEYMGVVETIESVLVDKTGGELWEIWVGTAPGLETVPDFEEAGAVHITVPSEAFNYGAGVGFSTYKEDMRFEYDGRTWQYDGGNTTGSLEVSLDGNQIDLDFTTYGDLRGHYAGTAVIVE